MSVNGKRFDPKAWVAAQAGKRSNLGGICQTCAHPEAAAAVREIAQLWGNGAQGITLTTIAEEVLKNAFGFCNPTNQTVSRHLRRCEPELWAKIEALRRGQAKAHRA